MGMKMTIDCGTYRHQEFTIDLDDYGEKEDRSYIDPRYEDASFALLFATMNDVSFADDGCRNEDAVNGCIALHVLGYDAEAWFENFCAEQGANNTQWFQSDLDKFMDHVKRICGKGSGSYTNYLHRWGPKGLEERALDYSI